MITPVLDQAQAEVEVTFPSTSDWFDFYTGKKLEGGQIKKVIDLGTYSLTIKAVN